MTTTAPKTVAQFRKAAVQSFMFANPDAADASITWERAEAVTWADGSRGFSGSMIVQASGFRTRRMLATYCGGMMVR